MDLISELFQQLKPYSGTNGLEAAITATILAVVLWATVKFVGLRLTLLSKKADFVANVYVRARTDGLKPRAALVEAFDWEQSADDAIVLGDEDLKRFIMNEAFDELDARWMKNLKI